MFSYSNFAKLIWLARSFSALLRHIRFVLVSLLCTSLGTNTYLVNNYCPISLLCNTSKILEQLIYNKVIHYISSFFTPQQFGFLKSRSTIQQLLVLFDVIMSSDHQTDVIYFDFKKALTVFHIMNFYSSWDLLASLEICSNGLNHIYLIFSSVLK